MAGAKGAMAKRDYYEVLGVNKDASEDDIKKAYRKLANVSLNPRRHTAANALAHSEMVARRASRYRIGLIYLYRGRNFRTPVLG